MKIDLKGIQTNLGPNNTQGTAQDIINLRNKYGEWSLIQPPKDVLYLATKSDSYYTHNIPKKDYYSNDKYVWGYNKETREVFRYDSFGGDYTVVLTLSEDEEFYNFTHFGNVFIVSTSLEAYNFLYGEDGYVLLSDLPEINFFVETVEREDTYDGEAVDVVQEFADETYLETVRAKALQVINILENNGKTNGHTFFIICYRTVTGEYILPSKPIYHYIGSPNNDDHDGANSYEPKMCVPFIGRSIVNVEHNGVVYLGHFGKPHIRVKYSEEQIAEILKYDGLIDSVVVFMSKPVYDHELNADESDMFEVKDEGTLSITNTHFFPNISDLSDLLNDTSSFYNVHEFLLSELGEINDAVIEYEEMETKETLPAIVTYKPIGKVMLDFNNRIHLGNITNKLPSTGNPTIDHDYIAYGDNNTSYHIPHNETETLMMNGYTDKNLSILVKLKINGETKTIFTPITKVSMIVDALTQQYYYAIPPFFSYPDSRAISMQIVEQKGAGYNEVTAPVTLKAHDFLNIACYSSDPTEYTDSLLLYGTLTVPTATKFRIFQYRLIKDGTILEDSETLMPIEDRYYQDKNRIQVSANSDPLAWPAINSYRTGTLDTTVKSITSNAIPLGDSQFGQFPLMVFTSDGIFALEQGTDVLYKSVQPVSLDVIQNSKAVPISSGIAFISEKGISIQVGRNAIVISTQLDGKFWNYLLGDEKFQKLTNGEDEDYNTGALNDYLTRNIDTLDYTNAAIGYDFVLDELYVSFPKYTFIYNITSKQWYKRSQSWESFIYDGGHLIGINNGQFQDINILPTVSEAVEFIYVSNPFTIDDARLKKYFNIYLNYIGTSNSDKADFAVYLYGSNNLQEWKLINGKRFKQLRKIELKNVRCSAKYHKVVIVGKHSEAIFNNLDIEVAFTD